MLRRRIGVALLLALGAGLAVGAAAPADKNGESYAIGFEAGRSLARSLKADGVDPDRAALLAGLADGFDGTPGRLSEADMKRILTDLQRRVAEVKAQETYKNDPVFRAQADANAARAKALLDERAAAAGAKKTAGGVVYQVIKAGDGQPAGDAGLATVSFHASTPGGAPIAHGSEVEVNLAELLPGARELLAAMRPGERVRAVVPPAAAFGLAGRDPDVGPNEAILVEVELHALKK